MSSTMIGDRLKERIAFQSQLGSLSQGKFAGVPGGVLILNDENVAIGAVGVSGDASLKDEFVAITAVQMAKKKSSPDAPNPTWKEAKL